jgi:hypothetical protein
MLEAARNEPCRDCGPSPALVPNGYPAPIGAGQPLPSSDPIRKTCLEHRAWHRNAGDPNGRETEAPPRSTSASALMAKPPRTSAGRSKLSRRSAAGLSWQPMTTRASAAPRAGTSGLAWMRTGRSGSQGGSGAGGWYLRTKAPFGVIFRYCGGQRQDVRSPPRREGARADCRALPGGRYPLSGPDLHRLEPASFAWRTRSRTWSWRPRDRRGPERSTDESVVVSHQWNEDISEKFRPA